MSSGSVPPHVLFHAEQDGDRAPLLALLDEHGASYSHLNTIADVRRFLDESEVDLALADSQVGGDSGPTEALLRALEERGDVELPLILLVRSDAELEAQARRVAGLAHAVLLCRPFAQPELATALRSALALRRRQREFRGLIARLGAANRELDRRRAQAEDQARKTTQLLAAISHNLLTPVNEVVLFCQVVQAASHATLTPSDWARLTAGLHTGVAALRELVDDLLDIARFDLGQVDFHPSAVPLGPFLERMLEGFGPDARRKGLDFQLEEVTPAGATVRTDPDHLARVVRNLVSNAIKFTDAGSVRVAARVAADGSLTIEITDTGRGIEPGDRAAIFDEFAQVQNPERDRTKGTGLGLPICRRLVAAMGGTITVAGAPGRGSSFKVWLPPHPALVRSP